MVMATSAALTCSPGGSERVHLAHVRGLRDLVGQPEQAVRLAGHRAHDHHDLIAVALRAERTLGDVLHSLEVADRGAAEFLNDEGQGDRPVPPDVREVNGIRPAGRRIRGERVGTFCHARNGR